ncbi:MAG: efflux RND transporter periplasmic adaptor subunit, partial [Isosphaeraceae bacterium]|nr:efflux RND transporter periplasmic adaptor subunit [Isosphaeraceae bacterium]
TNPWIYTHARAALNRLATSASRPDTATTHRGEELLPSVTSSQRWDGLIAVNSIQWKALGLETVEAQPQTEPIRLEVNGKTAFDTEAQIQIRPKFTSLIDKIYVRVGESVKAGDPLVDLFSEDLASAKSAYETKLAEWEHDKQQLERSRKLKASGARSEREYQDDLRDERRSFLEAKLAKDKLLVYGLTEQEIAKIPKEDGVQKGKMTMRAPADGVVIQKNVVKGNLYDITNVLLVIEPLDHFWVVGYVYPQDASRVSIGQDWEIRLPFLDQTHPAKIESIFQEVDPDTKTLKIRTRIPNLGGRLKADMLVGGAVLIPPAPGRTVIPRVAMVATDGADYVFVQVSDSGRTARFRRQPIRVAKEYHDTVIVSEGLRPGDLVVSKGSLIMNQIYEDAKITQNGMPL